MSATSNDAATSAAQLLAGSAHGIADAVRSRRISAAAMVEASLARIDASDGAVNAFTDRTPARARARAAAIDAELARGGDRVDARSLLGVPFAVKNLFDIAGVTTRAGAKIEREKPPAVRDGPLVIRLEQAGAVLVGALNMDEYAYGFTTENSHDGPTRNPHDLTRVAGGSSGGSAAALAAGQVPLTLGSDTNGSIRVPSSLCGVFGLKPTYGRLPRNGSYPFVASLDHLGPFARSAHDLALAYDAIQGGDSRDAACARRLFEPVTNLLSNGTEDLRIATLDGYFEEQAGPEARAAVLRVAEALGVNVSRACEQGLGDLRGAGVERQHRGEVARQTGAGLAVAAAEIERRAVALHQRPRHPGERDTEGADAQGQRIDAGGQRQAEPEADAKRSQRHRKTRERCRGSRFLRKRPDRSCLAARLMNAVTDRVEVLRQEDGPDLVHAGQAQQRHARAAGQAENRAALHRAELQELIGDVFHHVDGNREADADIAAAL